MEAILARSGGWWPREHFDPSVPLVQLPEGQTVTLRRQNDALVAVAFELPDGQLQRERGARVAPKLLHSSGPDTIAVLADTLAAIGDVLTLRARVPDAPAMIGVEFLGDSARRLPAARARFGIRPAPLGTTLVAGARAISDPVLLRVPASGNLPTRTADVLGQMAGSPQANRANGLGLYWELYGFAPTDTVEFAVWIERYTPEGIARRFGVALGITTDRNTPVASSWTSEAGLGGTVVEAGPVPVIGRTLVLDLSGVPEGEYWIDVVARKVGSDAVRSRRAFTVGK
jgi:hypothetical protein